MAITKVSRGLLNTGVSDSSDATAITITSDEKVGIGTTSPSYMLTVKSSSNNHFRMENGSELGVLFLDSDGDISLWAHGDENIKFLNGTGSGTERMRIDSAGNVGIGTTAIPHGGVGAAKLALDGGNQNFSTGPHVQMTTDADDHPLMQILSYGHDNVSINFDCYHDSSSWKSSDVGSNFQIYKLSDNLQFRYAAGVTAGTEPTWAGAMNIDSAGRVRINNVQGLAKFSVGNGTGNALIEMASSSATAVYYEHINRSNTSGDVDVGYYARAAGEHTFYTGSYTARFIINSSGGSNASDEKLKENIQNLSYGLDTVKSLKPRQFKWKDNQQKSIGFVAQEVESLIPEVVSEVSADIKEGTDEKIKALNYANLTAVLTKAIQEQQGIIEDLQQQINEVKNGN